ncbi:HIT family protein [Elizabethkingia meningoseptica]|uniref:HIT family protein n=1 Tax=Elizabethkingia meningoseptica TaxID=238 RepID=A0A1V3U2P2_ELIME|nr:MULTISPECIES: HIT family protein [Elizabethkingia]AQX04861.1 HIT family hydrolase [Elizabethkingia meningoseptica]AQX12320.1 HIT family hydrolase [Elizabethkingia meningoseptica]AQX46901.1 HIT family hydrolase [Elizabethkingia meningoseptica]EJK5330632.1 HIT family protein [Elizabethkingia meningoseptica]EOR29257.1 Diadenosine tetraphosphate (Ap4A) hydrolase and other HIT family hydrolase [Elizabethkingia meningoseptica ATCC 13253 = NBRC 12535]
MSSIFTKIINGEIPAYKIMEDEKHLAFLDVMPLVEGHTLVIPKKEVDLIFDLESDEFKELFSFAQKVAKKVGAAIPCKRVGVAVVGLEVPHAHIHLVPLQQLHDIDFSRERLKLSPEEYQKIQEKIANA